MPSISSAVEETCVSCSRTVLVSGQFSHTRGHESLTIEGAPRRAEEAFREDIQGARFTLTIPDLPAAKYTLRFGFAEVNLLGAGQRAFDIVCGNELLASNLDVFAVAGGAGKVYFVTSQVEHAGDAVAGPLTITFIGRTNAAKLNTFELRENRNVVVSMWAADLIGAFDDAAQPPVVAGPEIWRDASQPLPARVNDLVRRLSLAEKVMQMRNDAPAIRRLGIPAYNYWNECLHGVGRAGIATVFPQAIGLAAMWDEPLMRKIADTIATEGRAKHHDYAARHDGDSARYYGLTFWTPNINIFRDPRWGRGQETYGEDPFLTARLGVAFIRGLQGDHPKYLKAMACAKHFAVHSGPEPARHTFDVAPSERDFYETYLPHFEAAVKEGRVGAVMGAYNRVYGEPACSSTLLLTDILRRQWGFDGHVVSDCGAIYDIYANHKVVATAEEASARAVKAGCDLCCGMDYNSLVRAVKRGLLTERDIDTAVSRVLEARFRLGLFDPPSQVPFAQIPIEKNDCAEHQALALRAARESLVLLKNDGLLPLDRSKLKRIAVIGANADSVPMLLGNYNGTPSRPVTILEGIKSVAGAGIEIVAMTNYPLALPLGGNTTQQDVALARAVATAKSADVVIYCGGINPKLEGEEMKVDYEGFLGGDRTRIELPEIQTDLLKALHATGKPIVFVNCSGSAMAMPWEAENLPAIVQAFYPGQAGGQAVAELLFGDFNPAGRLPVTFYRSTADLPPFEDYSMSNRTYRYFTGRPLFAFGHGLSYTKFNYSNPRLARKTVRADGVVKFSINIENVGPRDGDEVVQVYFRPVRPEPWQPRMALCGFDRITVPRGKTARVSLEIPAGRFRQWDSAARKYIVKPGEYELLVGAASDDIRCRLRVQVR